jgi:hypothetical protein
VRGTPLLAFCLACSKAEPTPAPKIDYAAEEARALQSARARTDQLKAEREGTNQKAAELAAACDRIAAQTAACTALPASKREGARVCEKVADDDVKACIAYRKGLANGF